MSSVAEQFHQQNEPLELRVPEAALARLALALRRARQNGEVWEQSSLQGAEPTLVEELLDYWCDGFDFRAAEAQLNRLPLHATSDDGERVAFVHLRSKRPDAIPLLLLHGSFGSPLELAALFEPLRDPAQHGGRPSEAFHVVCPALPGFGITAAHASDLAQVAETCAELMASLGYRRYVAHGCELGAALARELAASDAPHLAGALLGDCPAYPEPEPLALAQLSGEEKSRLAVLDEYFAAGTLREPDGPVGLLAAAVAQLDDPNPLELRDALLFGLSLSLLGNAALQARLRRARAHEGPRSTRPLGVCSFPLDVPSLRRLAERRHRIVHWSEPEQGGCLPGLEQPGLLRSQLVEFCARFR
jgi:hypothetical protein